MQRHDKGMKPDSEGNIKRGRNPRWSGNRATVALTLMALTLLAPGAFAQSDSSQGRLRLTPKQIKAAKSILTTKTGSSGNSLVEEVVIHGDPSQPGLYTALLKVGPNARIAAHSHPDDRMATVLSGTWYFGYGHKFDAPRLKRLPRGSVYSEPAHADHFAMTRGPVIVQITGYGPSGVTYTRAAKATNAPTNRTPGAARKK